MNRFLIPLAAAVLVAGCSMPGLFGQQSSEPAAADSPQTVVVREIYHETPVYYVDTVYMAEASAPVQPVYVENEYNEYNETNVYVRKQLFAPPVVDHRERGWSPRNREPQPRDRSDDNRSPRDRNQPRDPEQPKIVNPQHPMKKTLAPATNERQKATVPPTKPTPPSPQAPAQSGSVQVTQVQNQAPTPSVGKPAVPVSDGVPVGMSQATRK
jgi:hypothetical protein